MNSSRHVLRIATRASRLALWQAEHVAALLRAAHPQIDVQLVPLTTQGDRILDRPLAAVGGKGLFIKELESALLERRADIAVHSMKDVPTEMPPGMALVAMLDRADPRDAFVSERHASFNDLPQGARLGTSSLRRQCQLLAARPDLQVLLLRGNLDTRLRRLQEGEYDAIVLAAAGLLRMDMSQHIRHYFPCEQSIPAVGQGVIGIEAREDDAININLVQALNDAQAWLCCSAERAFAFELQGSCHSPIGGHAWLQDDEVHLCGVVGVPDGSRLFKGERRGPAADAQRLGVELAHELLDAGAREVLAELRGAA